MDDCEINDTEPSDSGMMCENPVKFDNKHRKQEITFQRRIQLQGIAAKLAGEVLEFTKSHERCLLRSMVDDLINDR